MDLHFMETALASGHFIFGKGATFSFMKAENFITSNKVLILFQSRELWQVSNLNS